MNSNRIAAVELAQRSAGTFFHWEDPGEPLAVHFHLNVVELLARDAIRAGGKQIAGFLLGRRDEDRHRTILVEHYEPFPTGTKNVTSGSTFGDQRQPRAKVDHMRSPSQKRMSILGSYRSCSSGETSPSAEDLSFVRAASSDSERLFLLLEHRVGEVGNGILFIVQHEVVTWQWHRVPFGRAALSRETIARRPSVENGSPQSKQKVAPIEKQERLQIERISEGPRTLRWTLIAVASIALMAAGLFQFRRGVKLPAAVFDRPDTSSDSSLGLKLERRGIDWQLSWNRNADALVTATRGQLSITDGPIHKVLDLDSGELRSGSIIYTPATDNLIMRLDVTGTGASQASSESVRLIAGLNPPLLSQPQVAHSLSDNRADAEQGGFLKAGLAPVKASEKPNAPYPTANRPPSTGPPSTEVTELAKPEPSNTAATLKQGPATGQTSADLVATPLPIGIRRSTNTVVEAPATEREPLASHSEPVSVTPRPVVSAPIRQGGKVEPAELVFRREPIYSEMARRAGISGTVDLSFRISPEGKVLNVEVVRGNSILAKAAAETLQTWRYKPARLDGSPVEVEGRVEFTFRPL